MTRSFGRTLALVAASLLVIGGCGKNEEKGPMEKAGAAADKAIEKVKDASKDAARSVSEAADKAKDAAATAAASVGAAAEKAASGEAAPINREGAPIVGEAAAAAGA